MTAIACLRVAVDQDRTGLSPAVLGPLVAKFSAAYLETRWLWPRRFAPLDHHSFLLTDPRASEFDPSELARLADELQVKLFGERESGEVALLLFEGPTEVVTAFAGLDLATASAAIHDPGLLPPGGRLTRILPGDADRVEAALAEEDASSPSGPRWELLAGSRGEAEGPQPEFVMPQLEGVQGIYFTPRQLFVADVVSSTPGCARDYLSLVEGPQHMPADTLAFDADCIAAGAKLLEETSTATMLYFPVSYSNIIHAPERRAYERLFETLPQARRALLAATVYDVPRDPAFGSLSVVKETLARYFTNIDLRVMDPDFQIEKQTFRAVTSVTLVLPQSEQRRRMAVLRRFASRLALYKTKQVWPAVTNVRSRAELQACADLRVPFVTGPAVCRMQTQPVGGRPRPLTDLPLLAA